MMVSRVSLFLLFCLSASAAHRTIAQLVHKAWVGKDGAPANVKAITQTKDGYLWLASSQGLYRFDGVAFERFALSGQPFTSVPVISLLSCPNGDLWVGSAVSGISLLRNGTNRNYTTADGFPDHAVLSIARDRQGAIWAATSDGLAQFDGTKWRKIGSESGFEGTPISLYVARGGTLWAATPKTIFFLSPGAARFQQVGFRTGWVMDMLESPNGKMWMAQLEAKQLPNGEFQSPVVRPMPPSKIDAEISVGSQRILFDRDDSLWITTLGDGLLRVAYPDRLTHEKFGKSSDQIESLTARDGLSADFVTSIHQDHEGTIWVGTSGGLDRFTKSAVVRAPAPSGAFTRSALAAGEAGDVWVGGLNHDIGRIHDNRWFPAEKKFTAFSAVTDANGATWWADLRTAYREIDGRFTGIGLPHSYETNLEPTRFTVDRSGALWLSGAFGIFVRRNGEWKAIDVPRAFPGKTPTLAYADAAGRVWFGYQENSILVIDGPVRRVFSAQQELRVGAVLAIFISGASGWIAGSKGLQFFDGQHFRDIIPAGGGAFGSVSGVLETSDGSLWLNSFGGLVRIAPAAVSKLKAGATTAEYLVFDTLDGLPGATQQSQPYPTLIQAKDGKLWFGSSAGPVWIDPKDLPRNELQPPVVIRSLTANGKRYASFTDLRLPALTRDLEIGYTGLSLRIPERVRFRYQLAGSDKNWQDAGTRRQAFYTNLGPGQYRFRVLACNNEGVWNMVGATLPFTIAPAWFQTNWFRAFCACVALLLFWMLYQLRVRQLLKQFNVALEARVDERTRIARDLHDTLLQSFQALMLRLQVVNELLPEGKAKQQLEQTLKRADQAVAEGRRAVFDLRTSTITTNDLAEAVRTLGDEMVTQDSAAFRLMVEGQARNLHPIVRDELYRITREAVQNAFSHAQAHNVEVEITYADRLLRLRIRDDGTGIPKEMLERGRPGHYGLPGMRERARQIGAKLTVWSGAGGGTEIELSITASVAYGAPPNRSHLRLFEKE
jgi:signal transduction histidine kinase/ligand-binding sensor domain-containing protein